MRRAITVVTFVFAALGLLTAILTWQVRSRLEERYIALRAGQDRGAKYVEVDRNAYDQWIAAIQSSDRETLLTTPDGFSDLFPQLPAAGFTADIDGYLELLTVDLPPPEELSIFELVRWNNAAVLRFALGSNDDAPLHVYRSDGIIRGFCLWRSSTGEVLHLGLLQNGAYAEYISQPKPAAEQKADGGL